MKTNLNSKILAGICILVLGATGCNLTMATPAPTATIIIPVTGETPTATFTATQPPAATNTPAAATEPPAPTLSPTPNDVTVTASPNGSLGILRGPSLYYDVLGYLQNSQSSTAVARNSDGSWLYMAVPNYPTVYGWAYVKSIYSTTQGDVNTLPVKLVDPAVAAYIRNCTFHPMLIQPGNVLLQPQTDLSNRKKQFPPGSYTAYDQSAQGKPQVLTITLKEGDSVDILKDGLKNAYTCP